MACGRQNAAGINALAATDAAADLLMLDKHCWGMDFEVQQTWLKAERARVC